MLRPLLLSLLVISSCGACSAQTPIDIQPAKQLVRGNSLGTCGYTPTEKEKPFYDKLNADERVTGSAFSKPYKIQGKKNHYVSWFGIVRGISRAQSDGNQVTMLLENKFFDGMTDCHIMLVANSGGGDFRAILQGDAKSIPALALVRVYGKVVKETDKVPVIAVEYFRVWPWLTFALSDLGGDDHSNPRWAKYCTLCKNGRVYNPFPTPEYYFAVLGDPKDFGLNLEAAK